jgi:hypothetical protein
LISIRNIVLPDEIQKHGFRTYSRTGILVTFEEMLWLRTARPND